jgi:hypothetical protein
MPRKWKNGGTFCVTKLYGSCTQQLTNNHSVIKPGSHTPRALI